MSLAKLAYESYKKKAGGRSAYSGDPLPVFEKLSPPIQECWEAAADAVRLANFQALGAEVTPVRCELTITYRPIGGAPVSLVAITDRQLLRTVAQRAIQEYERYAVAMAEANPLLGELQHQETQQLKHLLVAVLPELAEPPGDQNEI